MELSIIEGVPTPFIAVVNDSLFCWGLFEKMVSNLIMVYCPGYGSCFLGELSLTTCENLPRICVNLTI